MENTKELAILLFLGFVFSWGFIAVIWPSKIVAYYQRFGWVSDNPFFGGYYYSTPKRARITGGVLAFVVFTVGIIHLMSKNVA
jgi:hypothetical protein